MVSQRVRMLQESKGLGLYVLSYPFLYSILRNLRTPANGTLLVMKCSAIRDGPSGKKQSQLQAFFCVMCAQKKPAIADSSVDAGRSFLIRKLSASHTYHGRFDVEPHGHCTQDL